MDVECVVPARPHPDKVVQCRISSIQQIVNIVLLFDSDNESWVYRGQNDATWHLTTSLEREVGTCQDFGARLSREKNAIKKFQALTRGRLDFGESFIDWLSAMQHYGCKTRLLDFSRSLLIALFFAVMDKNGNLPSTDFALWCLNFKKAFDGSEIVDKLIRSEVVASAQKPKGVSQEEYDEALQIGRDALKCFAFYDESERILKSRTIANKMLIGESEFKYGVMPVDLPSNNERILAQNGLFVLPANFEGFELNLIETLKVEKDAFGDEMEDADFEKIYDFLVCKRLACAKFVIGREIGEDVVRLLKAANITPRTVYPDISGIVPFV